MSGDPEEVVLESGAGGRIYERTAAGERHEWGEVTVWEPPRRLAYLWHIGRDRADGHRGRDHLRRRGRGRARTRIEIEHSGWEVLGDEADAWRDKNRGGWDALLPHFVAAAERGAD